ncbi:hypothetical protein VNO78_25251 [Psophocarpus tetragonolobus]|uniref:Uncharacterized protein n=1 Tax=Psophocarpus tetragonolobus TaxID=3891 RepID=A0AAN9XFM9_PSOTE
MTILKVSVKKQFELRSSMVDVHFLLFFAVKEMPMRKSFGFFGGKFAAKWYSSQGVWCLMNNFQSDSFEGMSWWWN